MSSANANNIPTPEKATIETIGGIEGLYDLLKSGTEAEKENSSISRRIFKGPETSRLG